jgi:tartrate dehydratase beta subunit/fumarate hydratase class I family protein
MLTRHLEKPIPEDLEEKIVFIAGPRQVDKTTLAQAIGPTNVKFQDLTPKAIC